jgi:hypothetical protein
LINRDSKRGGGIRGGLALFLECVLLPTLPPYRSDTSISFFKGIRRNKPPFSGGGVKRALARFHKGGGWEKIKCGVGKPPDLKANEQF